MKKFYALFFLLCSPLCADLASHLQPLPERPLLDQIPHIDAIYLINLPERPEKWERSRIELRPYGIRPCRFPAINGSMLSLKTLQEVGLVFQKGMANNLWIQRPDLEGLVSDFLTSSAQEVTHFAQWTSLGAIGCTLSHLSVLQDAYDAGYETIWVLEDDIKVRLDPNRLASLIEKLDPLAPDWDVLYTDLDQDAEPPLYEANNDFESDLKGNLWFFWRPDFPEIDKKRLAKRTIVSADFLKIGSRMRTHSMLIRRSGMKKILDFEKKHRIFIPYDHEIALVPQIQLYSLRYPLVTFLPKSPSDTKTPPRSLWDQCRESFLQGHPDIDSMRTMAQFFYKIQPQLTVEVGAQGGFVTYPLASTLKFIGQGKFYAIDSWQNQETLYQRFLYMLYQSELEDLCFTVREDPKQAASQFADRSIDLLLLNADLEEAKAYLPKMKSGGWIWLQQAALLRRAPTVDFLMNHCTWDKTHSLGISWALFKVP